MIMTYTFLHPAQLNTSTQNNVEIKRKNTINLTAVIAVL